MRYLKIVKNATEIDYSSLNLILSSFRKESLSPTNLSEKVEGRDGSIPLATEYGERKLTAIFVTYAFDYYDFDLLQDEIFKLFQTRDEMTIIDSKQPGKQWHVKVENVFSVEAIGGIVGRFQVDFISSKPYGESVGTTMDPQTFDSELWQIGQGLITEETSYTHTTTTFRIYNAGDEEVNPEKLPLIIKYKGASTNLEIKNLTTGDVWKYTGTTLPGAVIELNGVKSFKNGASIFSDTNWAVIKLAPGWNDIELIGTNGSFEISFDFRFYYV
ncbi:phage tail family protein [Metabacillus litoralis]|uniref:phage tail family protein n=1 Tax=Metabacillus litoralis TaxID=152268 RepID=UPI00203E4E4E|nr:phage tail family protein [Metabacillus litoralis]MCM3651335.1 phage tail family protein [Metabacillus litoralis]